MNTGYFPGIASIGDKIVYIENRDGNANVKTWQAKTLERSYQLLNNNEIYVNRSRMDAGSYSEEIIQEVAKYSQLFYIRANKCESLTEGIRQITDWQAVEINFKNYQVTSIPFTHFLAERNYRLVVMREKTSYLILTAMLKNFHNYLVGKVSRVFTGILPVSRLKRFIFRFISVPGRYVYRGRQWVLQIYSDRPYEKVFT